jgi:hypothetical protein
MFMKNFVIYDVTGRITRWGSCPMLSALSQALDGEFAKVVNDLPADVGRDYYVLDGALVARSAIEGVSSSYTVAADGIDAVTFTLPIGTVVVFDDVEHTGEEAFRFTSDIPGTYRFRIVPPVAFLDMEVVIDAV